MGDLSPNAPICNKRLNAGLFQPFFRPVLVCAGMVEVWRGIPLGETVPYGCNPDLLCHGKVLLRTLWELKRELYPRFQKSSLIFNRQ